MRRDSDCQVCYLQSYGSSIPTDGLGARQTAFHPNAAQEIVHLPINGLVAIKRVASDGSVLVALNNLTEDAKSIPCSLIGGNNYYDELAEQRIYHGAPIQMNPFQVRWLTEE